MSIRIAQQPNWPAATRARNNNYANAPRGVIFRTLPRASQFGSRRIAICPTNVALNIHTLPTARLWGNANHRGHHESAQRARAKNRELENHARTNHEACSRRSNWPRASGSFCRLAPWTGRTAPAARRRTEGIYCKKQASARAIHLGGKSHGLPEGRAEKTESFQVRMGPDGKPQKLLSVPRPLLKMIPAHAAAAASASASWPRRKKNTRTTPSK